MQTLMENVIIGETRCMVCGNFILPSDFFCKSKIQFIFKTPLEVVAPWSQPIKDLCKYVIYTL